MTPGGPGISTGLANGPLESFSLLDLEGLGLEEAFPHVYSIAHDGYGNYWVLDLLPESGDWGPVFYACHDPAVIAYQVDTIEAFLRDVVAMWQPGPPLGPHSAGAHARPAATTLRQVPRTASQPMISPRRVADPEGNRLELWEPPNP